MIARLKLYLAAVGVGIAVVWQIIRTIRKDERAKANLERTENNLKAAKEAKDTKHELEIGDDQRLVDILSGKLHKPKR
jgi:predicted small secreted protein